MARTSSRQREAAGGSGGTGREPCAASTGRSLFPSEAPRITLPHASPATTINSARTSTESRLFITASAFQVGTWSETTQSGLCRQPVRAACLSCRQYLRLNLASRCSWISGTWQEPGKSSVRSKTRAAEKGLRACKYGKECMGLQGLAVCKCQRCGARNRPADRTVAELLLAESGSSGIT